MLRAGHCRWLLLLFAAGGCARYQFPDICHPGSFSYQRWRAETSDPYPLPDLGPNVDGGRPPGFSKPAPEPERAVNASLYQRFGPPPPRY